MGNFSIVFKNSLQNKKHPASSCIATRDKAFRRLALAIFQRGSTQPKAELAGLARTSVVASTASAPLFTEANLEKLDVCSFRQRRCTLRQPRPSVLSNVQDVALGQLNANPVRLHLEAQDVRHYFCSVRMADGRLNVRRDLFRVDLLHPNKVHCLHRKHR